MSGWFQAWFGVVLREPLWLFVALLVLPVLWLRWRAGAGAVTFSPAALFARGRPVGAAGDLAERSAQVAPLPVSWRVRLRELPTLLLVAAVSCAAVALARPVQRVPLPQTSAGIDIVLCLDVSSSMAQRDLDPDRTRLAVAKATAQQFTAGRPHDRIGLLQFARFVDVVCPPTLDHLALAGFLDGIALVEHEGPEDRTGIGVAVARAVRALANSESSSRVVILVTDGEENVASAAAPDEIGPLQAAQLAVQHGVRVYTVAVGRGSRGPGGRLVPLDTGQVEQLAERTGGRFHRAATTAAVRAVYDEIDGLERVEFEQPRFRLEDRLLPWLLAALVAALLAHGLRAGPLAVYP